MFSVPYTDLPPSSYRLLKPEGYRELFRHRQLYCYRYNILVMMVIVCLDPIRQYSDGLSQNRLISLTVCSIKHTGYVLYI